MRRRLRPRRRGAGIRSVGRIRAGTRGKSARAKERDGRASGCSAERAAEGSEMSAAAVTGTRPRTRAGNDPAEMTEKRRKFHETRVHYSPARHYEGTSNMLQTDFPSAQPVRASYVHGLTTPTSALSLRILSTLKLIILPRST